MGCGTSVEDGDDSNGLSLGKSEKGELSLVKTCFNQLTPQQLQTSVDKTTWL